MLAINWGLKILFCGDVTWGYFTLVWDGAKTISCLCVKNPSPYFAAALVSQHRPSCCLWRASPASQSETSPRRSHSSSPRNAPSPLWPPPPASWTCSLHPAALSSCAGLRPAAWGAPFLAGAAPSPALGQCRAPGTPCARAHQLCVRGTIPVTVFHFNQFAICFWTKITWVTNFRPRSSLLSMCWRFRWSPLPMALSSLFGLSGFFALSLGFSESPSSHLSGFFRSYMNWNNNQFDNTWGVHEGIGRSDWVTLLKHKPWFLVPL